MVRKNKSRKSEGITVASVLEAISLEAPPSMPIGPDIRAAVLGQLGFDRFDPSVKVIALTKEVGEKDVAGDWAAMQIPRSRARAASLAPIKGFRVCLP